MTQPAKHDTNLRVADLPQNRETAFDLRPDAAALREIAAEIDVLGVKKLTFQGQIRAQGASDWLLEGRLGATVVQACVVTLEPVTTRIDEDVRRLYLADPSPILPEGEEVEMPEDDSAEPLGTSIDPGAVMREALVLALPLWPRAAGVAPADVTVTEPGQTPLTEEAMKPFAGLAGLRDRLAGSDDSEK